MKDYELKPTALIKKLLTPDRVLLSGLDYIDGSMYSCLLVPYADKVGLSVAERFRLCYMYALCYSPATAIYLFNKIKHNHSEEQIEDTWNFVKPILVFSPDRARIKNSNQAMISLLQTKYILSEHSINKFLNMTEDERYAKILRDWKYFGPMAAFLFFDAMYALLPEYYKDVNQIPWSTCGDTVVKGVDYVTQNYYGTSHLKYSTKERNDTVRQIQRIIKQPLIYIESELCALTKVYKRTRYVGYYADRMMEECYKMAPYLAEMGVNVWTLRDLSIPKKYLGEKNGWFGVGRTPFKEGQYVFD